MTPLSVAIITLNEEKNIERCIDSVQEVADEIVIVDSFSQDKTEEICRKYEKVKFISHEFEGYIEQKNYAIDQAQNQFILSLDADEALSEELMESIMQAKKNPMYDGYSMNRMTNYCGKWIRHSDWYPDVKYRLFNREKIRWGGVNPHDKLIIPNNASTKHLAGDLLHYSYHRRWDHLRQIEHFTNVASEALYKKGTKSNILRLYSAPFAKFIKLYFLKLGFLDGKAGYTISRLSALATYMKYKKLKELYRNESR